MSLQWSHGLSAMDTSWGWGYAAISTIPSMEPWPFSHGYGPDGQRYQDHITPSMEPWPFSHGYAEEAAVIVGERVPSMEPWPFSHGYNRFVWQSHISLDYLQWSHGLSAMDTRHSFAPRQTHRHPSMEPWPFSHGYMTAATSTATSTTPFNGATAFQPWIRCGGRLTPGHSNSLQWSHGFSAMDT